MHYTASPLRAAPPCTRRRALSATAPPSAPHVVVTVPLRERSYPIHIGRGLSSDSELLQSHVAGGTALVITNDTVAPLHLQRCARRQPPRRFALARS